MKYRLLFVIFIVLIYSCNKNNEPNPKQVINDLEERFPQLIEGKNVKEREFKHIRTVIVGETEVQIQLYSQDESINNSHQIIVFVNKNKSVAIPLFNNRQRDYWQFANDKLIDNVAQVNTTFEEEYNDAIFILRKEKTFKDSFLESNLLIELLRSVLHTKRIDDETLEMCKVKYAASDIPVENEDSVRVRFEKNYEEIKESVKKHNVTYYYCYDTNSHRIYSINYDDNKKVFKFKIYRQDFGAEPIKPIYL